MDDVTGLALAARDGDRVALSSFVRTTWTDLARAAEICGCPVGTIRSRVARARDVVVAELGPVAAAPADEPTRAERASADEPTPVPPIPSP